MLEEYVVEVAIPIEVGEEIDFVFGWQFGYHQNEGAGEGENDEPVLQYWDGQDIWLPPEHKSLCAMFMGTLHFVRSGQAIRPFTEGGDEEEGEARASGYPAICDTLVLEVWPADFIKLTELLPEGAPIPKEIIYQNVDQDSVREKARILIRQTHSEENFTEDDIHAMVSRWMDGKGTDLLVKAGDEIGCVADEIPPLPDDNFTDIPNSPAPEGVDDSWGQLTLKVIDEKGLYYNPSYLFYLISRTDNEEWTTRPRIEDEDPFVDNCSTIVDSLHIIKVTSQLREGWNYEEEPDDHMPPAVPQVVLLMRKVDQERGIPLYFDPFEQPEEGYWRVQGFIPAGDYRWSQVTNLPLYGAPILEQQMDYGPNGLAIIGLRLDPSRLPIFDEYYRFILGVNYESVRRRNKHDLSGNDIYGYARGYLDDFYDGANYIYRDGANYSLLMQDLENIALTGARAIRVWVFEQFEGLRFHFSKPAANGGLSILDTLKRDAHDPHVGVIGLTKTQISKVKDPDPDNWRHWVYACTSAQWRDELRWYFVPPNPDNWVEPQGISNDIFERLLTNAEFLQQQAGECGLRVLWTLWAQYNETMNLNGDDIDIYEFIRQAGSFDNEYRLPIEAWIYREMMTDRDFRRSYINHAVIPFIQRMENGAGAALGYEVMNETDTHWTDCGDPSKKLISGADPGTHNITRPTKWTFSRSEIREFISECAENIGRIAPNKLIISGVLGSLSACTENELSLLQPTGSPPLNLSFCAITRYADATDWSRDYVRPAASVGYRRCREETKNDANRRGTHRITDFDSQVLHHGKCLFVEIGRKRERPDPRTGLIPFDCSGHSTVVRQALRKALHNGYAGVFVWNYHDPARSTNDKFASHALTEAQYQDQNQVLEHSNRLHTENRLVNFLHGAQARPACDQIKAFSELWTRLMLPPP